MIIQSIPLSTRTGFFRIKAQTTEDDKLFAAILEKYKGEVVFADFWATWCGPCIRGMERMKPLKEELKNGDIEFID